MNLTPKDAADHFDSEQDTGETQDPMTSLALACTAMGSVFMGAMGITQAAMFMAAFTDELKARGWSMTKDMAPTGPEQGGTA